MPESYAPLHQCQNRTQQDLGRTGHHVYRLNWNFINLEVHDFVSSQLCKFMTLYERWPDVKIFPIFADFLSLLAIHSRLS
jgi:hypothetical protein